MVDVDPLPIAVCRRSIAAAAFVAFVAKVARIVEVALALLFQDDMAPDIFVKWPCKAAILSSIVCRAASASSHLKPSTERISSAIGLPHVDLGDRDGRGYTG